jgi:hypothetical protein
LLLTLVLSIEECVFLVEYIVREGNRYTDLEQQQFAEKFPETPVPHRYAVGRLIEKFHVRCQTKWETITFVSAQRLSEHTVC